MPDKKNHLYFLKRRKNSLTQEICHIVKYTLLHMLLGNVWSGS